MAPVLGLIAVVAQHAVLLPHIVALGEGGLQPQLDLLHDLQVLLRVDAQTLLEPNWRHSRAVAGDDAQHHSRGREPSPVDGEDI